MICNYWFFNHRLELHDSACNVCHDLTNLCHNIIDFAIIIVKNMIIVILLKTLANRKQLTY